MTSNKLSVVVLGGSGAVGTQVVHTLLGMKNVHQLTLLGRTPILSVDADKVNQYKINIFDSSSYEQYLEGHQVAICTLGVGQPAQMSREEFVKIDKQAVIDFAKACKKAGVTHFQLLASVGLNSKSASFYLKTKGELVDALEALNFERLSIFQPSMILTPTNRYGMSQAFILKVWPLLKCVLKGRLTKYRGIPVDVLGRAMALNISNNKTGLERLEWEQFYSITDSQNPI